MTLIEGAVGLFVLLEDCLSWDWRLTTLCAIIAPLLCTYLITSLTSIAAFRGSKRPPTMPYLIPWLGHLPGFAFDGKKLLLQGTRKYGHSTPFKLQMPTLTQWHISGPENVKAYYKGKGLTGNIGTVIAMETSFGMPQQAVDFYAADDGGHLANPKPGCTVKPEDRVMYEIHKLVNTDLSGESLIGITARFQKTLAQKLTDLDLINDEWTDIPDLYAFMQKHVMEAATEAMFGTYILSLNPTFLEDFWAWNVDMGTLYMRIPRLLVPKAYRNRTKVLENIKRWHRYAREHCDYTKVGTEDAEWDPYFGSKFSRKRQALLSRWDQIDETARAAEDLGFIWAANANAIPAALWFLLEVLVDPSLQPHIQKEFSQAIIVPAEPSQVPVYDINKLSSGNLCQAIFAETLRLRVGVMVQRQAMNDLDFCGWRIKKGERLTLASSNEAFDETIWNAGSESDPHPLQDFWADRFLVYPNDPTSGPLKTPRSAKVPYIDEKTLDRGEPKFSLEGLANSWIPFSGAPRLCPGRHFAKQEMISTAAIFMAAFDIELKTKPGWKPQNDKMYFGFGTMPPKEKIPCRLRRR